MTINELNAKCTEKYGELNVEIHDVKGRVSNLEIVIEKLSSSVEAIQSLTRSVDKLAINMDSTLKELKLQGSRLSTLENKPARRWEAVVQALITTAIGIFLGWLFSNIVK